MTATGAAERLLLGFAGRHAIVHDGEPVDIAGRDQGRRHDLGQAGTGQGPSDAVAQRERVVAVRRHRRFGQPRRHELVAANADDLLDEVRLHGQVPSPGRDRRVHHLVRTRVDDERPRAARDGDHAPGVGGSALDPDPGEQLALFVDPQRRPEQPVHAGGSEGDVRRCWLDGIRIDDAGGDRAARPFGDQAGRAIGAEPGQARLDALLEPQARLGPEGVAEGRPADAHRVEDGRLDDDVRRRGSDLGAGPAHDAGDGERPGRVGDEQRLGMQLADDVVEGLEAFTRRRPAHHDPPVVHGGRVERVDRLAQLDHHVVAGIDDVADRAHAGGQQAHLHRIGRRADADAAHPATDEPRAQVRLHDVDDEPLSGRTARLLDLGRREPQRPTGHGRDLAGQAHDREGVAAVGLDVDVQHDIAEEVGQGDADRRVRRQDEDPVRVRGHAQLVARAEHPVADHAHLLGSLDPAVARQHGPGQGDRHALAGGDVRRAAHDVERFAAPDGHPGQRQAVRPGMLLDRQQLADDHVPPVRAPAVDALDLHPQQRQALGEALRRQVEVDELAQPAERDPHRNCSRKRRSFSMYRRRSPTPWRRFAIRSTPIPNAKPW